MVPYSPLVVIGTDCIVRNNTLKIFEKYTIFKFLFRQRHFFPSIQVLFFITFLPLRVSYRSLITNTVLSAYQNALAPRPNFLFLITSCCCLILYYLDKAAVFGNHDKITVIDTSVIP
jgi:hypothetical protein